VWNFEPVGLESIAAIIQAGVQPPATESQATYE
jgi:hypothetical protein